MSSIPVEKHPDSATLPEGLWQKINAITDEIRQRAYGLFEKRGRQDGSHLEDWLEAERELVWSPESELIESDGSYRAKLDLPGFGAKDVQVTAIPNALIVSAASSSMHEDGDGHVRISDFSERTLFRRLDLPSEIDVDKVTASLDKGVLEVTAPKAKEITAGEQ